MTIMGDVEAAVAPHGREMRATRKGLMFLRKGGGNTWDESSHPRNERGQFGFSLAHAVTDRTHRGKLPGRSVVSGDALRAALPPGTKSYEGIPLKSIREVHLASPEEFAETGLHALIYKAANPRTGIVPASPTWMYSKQHQQEAADAKFAKAAKLAEGAHDDITRAAKRDLASRDERTRAAAAVVGLIDATTMRVGGSDSEEETGSVGATTMRVEHITRVPGGLRFQFPGKSGKPWDRTVTDPALVKAVMGFMAGKNKGDQVFPVSDAQVNKYLAPKVAGAKVTAKDFRTYHATSQAHDRFAAEPAPATPAKAKATIAKVIKAVAEHLGNTPAVCKSSYIDPRAIDRYLARMPSGVNKADISYAPYTQAQQAAAVAAYAAFIRAEVAAGAEVLTPNAAMLDDD